MEKRINPLKACGSIQAVPSKSAAHRALICAAFAQGSCRINCPRSNEDIAATVRCLRALGAEISETQQGFTVKPLARLNEQAELDCGESGSTLRFMLSVVTALGVNAKFMRRRHLAKRPLSPLYEVLTAHGAELSAQASEPFCAEGKIKGCAYQIDGAVSSQYISGLLLAMPLLKEPCTLEITGEIASESYINLTLEMMRKFGVCPRREKGIFYFSGEETYQAPQEITVEGDWSNAAFFLAMRALKSEEGVTVRGLDLHSAQGDRAIGELLAEFGAVIEKDEAQGALKADKGTLKGIKIDAAQIPDLVPILAVVAAAAEGRTEIYHAARLRLKECDRLAALRDNLTALGAEIKETADGLIIDGGRALKGARVRGYNDHRIIMSMAAAALLCDGTVTIDEAEAVSKSYPSFWEDWAKICEEASE